jgi:GNAT superfamily N-acetyltransferase
VGDGPDGAAYWVPADGPDRTPAAAAAAGQDRAVEQFGAAAWERLVGAIEEFDDAVRARVSAPHWYLAAVAVAPERWRRGLGSALVRAFLARAATDGVPACLWTTQPRNVAFYRGLGFDLVEERMAERSGLRLWLFRRDPPGWRHRE